MTDNPQRSCYCTQDQKASTGSHSADCFARNELQDELTSLRVKLEAANQKIKLYQAINSKPPSQVELETIIESQRKSIKQMEELVGGLDVDNPSVVDTLIDALKIQKRNLNEKLTLTQTQLEESRKALDFIEGEVAKVYCHITGGKLSKANYYAQGVISEADEYSQKFTDDEVEHATKELSAEVERLTQRNTCLDNIWHEKLQKQLEEARVALTQILSMTDQYDDCQDIGKVADTALDKLKGRV